MEIVITVEGGHQSMTRTRGIRILLVERKPPSSSNP